MKFPWISFHNKNLLIGIVGSILLIAIVSLSYFLTQTQKNVTSLNAQEKKLSESLEMIKKQVDDKEKELVAVQNEDQYKKNKALEDEIKNIHDGYEKAVSIYEELVKLKEQTNKTEELDKRFTKALTLLSEKNYASASAELNVLSLKIKDEQSKLVASFTIPKNVPVNNAPPGSGYRRQQVQIDIGSYLVDIFTADLNSVRVIVDTAADGDCRDNCPVLALGDYVSRSGAIAGINGPYFCPASYPSCAGKTNSFDTLLMNKNKVYFNSDNNVYSTVPAVIFTGNSARFVGQSLEWGRDTGVDSVIASQPMLLSGGNIVYGGDSEPKRGSKGSRSFIGTSGSTVYIGVVHNATVAEVARVLHGLGIQYALNLDSGGSTAFWVGGYKVGPGRATPFGILIVGK
ncbi:hypothetical protein A2862_03615 [Candidatus Roizmanbacteria bacterium RIFCSPHIGHO2_01_FULL_38_41]|uniref:Phosphodiester glycosidase domain-containing protein n=1 Tax=Candidatus Roizmanbacteria bacterium RIFCSPHIGHO2_02_FULL_37_24 TaxID=1802037 RepID=A0A1F7GVK7_9BACT|nr:MAG: hypothetical protein A2862_03615 [Candidatus Roizmanbacteria bacterium RIFCSPHIGHO2_01_FULL_38_41]OGK22835.1 MAG: hypothetical protein A3C24_04425 [Candidatus Roizmanbacteria bacterium RIFCSPHIGHO2_02_FULL_37_24]OGK33801.1 MAG: hypothetical protein A3E10_02730 [Candidatus Roizmanbacteria bacterium RIFCSPHIGHO2_12_FULL_37_23]